jgi:hypothetical protein
MTKVHVEFQRRWRLADEKGKSVCGRLHQPAKVHVQFQRAGGLPMRRASPAEGFTSPAKAEQWAEEQGLTVEAKKPAK